MQPEISSWSLSGIDPDRRDDAGYSVVDSDLPAGMWVAMIGFDRIVMMATQQHQIAQRGRAAAIPGNDVVGITRRRRPVAPGEHATSITGGQRGPDRWGDQSVLAADIEYLTVPAQHGGQDARVAGQLAQLGGGQFAAGVEQVGIAAVGEQALVLDQHHEPGVGRRHGGARPDGGRRRGRAR